MEKLDLEIRRLIDDLLRVRNVNTTGPISEAKLNAELLKMLKATLRRNEQSLPLVFDYIRDSYLPKDNAIVRLYAVLLVDEIFRRSHRFREYAIENFEDFLKYTVETDVVHFPLPPPKSLSKQLKEKTLKIIHEWFNSYGTAYRKLQASYDYLKSCKTFDFQRIEAETLVERERSEQERRRQEQTKARVVKKVLDDLQEIEDDMQQCLTEINTAFRLLIPEFTNNDGTDPVSTSNEDKPSISKLHAHGLPNVMFDLSINVPFGSAPVRIDQDNIDLANNLRDCNKVIAGRYLPKIKQLLNIVSRYGGDEAITKRLINWRMQLDDAKRKFDDLRLDQKLTTSKNVEEDDDFEIVPEKEGFEEFMRPASPTVPVHIREWSKNEARKAETSKMQDQIAGTSKSPESSSLPVIPTLAYGMDLKYWEEEKIEKPLIARSNADCHRFWRSPDDEGVVQCSDKEAEAYRLRVIPFVGEFEPVERECRAPLTGPGLENRLCTRKDRNRCPFHGIIIPRDETGRPLMDNVSASSVESKNPNKVFGDKEFLKDIEQATGKQLTNQKGKRRRTETDPYCPPAETTRMRLEKKIFNRSSLKRIAAVQKAVNDAKHKKKFGGHWQYTFRDQ